MGEIYLPTLHYFENKNRFSGSDGTLRFMLTPIVVMRNAKEVNLEESSIKGELWHGTLCYDKSTMEVEQMFPMSGDGVEEIRRWLEQHR